MSARTEAQRASYVAELRAAGHDVAAIVARTGWSPRTVRRLLSVALLEAERAEANAFAARNSGAAARAA